LQNNQQTSLLSIMLMVVVVVVVGYGMQHATVWPAELWRLGDYMSDISRTANTSSIILDTFRYSS